MTEGLSKDSFNYHLKQIAEARRNAQKADDELREAVRDARAAGDSWTRIAIVLGTTRQAAAERFT